MSLDTESYKVTHVCVPDGTETYVGRYAWFTGFGNKNILYHTKG